jgi:hypothetical protein
MKRKHKIEIGHCMRLSSKDITIHHYLKNSNGHEQVILSEISTRFLLPHSQNLWRLDDELWQITNALCAEARNP